MCGRHINEMSIILNSIWSMFIMHFGENRIHETTMIFSNVQEGPGKNSAMVRILDGAEELKEILELLRRQFLMVETSCKWKRKEIFLCYHSA
jgi:hypothetical protein